MTNHVRAGTTGAKPFTLEVTPERAGWDYSALRVLELGSAADLGIECIVIDDVVAVEASRGGLEIRREIDVAHAQFREIRHERGSLREGEAAVELQAIRGARRVGASHTLDLLCDGLRRGRWPFRVQRVHALNMCRILAGVDTAVR